MLPWIWLSFAQCVHTVEQQWSERKNNESRIVLATRTIFLFDFFLSELVHPVQCHTKNILIYDFPFNQRSPEEMLKARQEKGCVVWVPLLCREEEEGCPDSPPHPIERLGFPRDSKLQGQGSLICLFLLLLLVNSTPFGFCLSCLLPLFSFLFLFSFSSLFALYPFLSLAFIPHSSFFFRHTSPLHSSLFTLHSSDLSASFIHSSHLLINERTHSSPNRHSYSLVWLNRYYFSTQQHNHHLTQISPWPYPSHP